MRHELAHCNGWKHPEDTNGRKFNVGDNWDEAEGAKWVVASTKASMPNLPASTKILPAFPPVVCVTPEWKQEPCAKRLEGAYTSEVTHCNGWGDNHASRAALGCSGGDFGWPRSIMRLD